MIVKCPHCHQALEATQEDIGATATCPSCNNDFIIPRPAKVKLAAKKSPNAFFGDFMLGFGLSVIGIFIAHMIHGAPGAKAALRGFLLEFLGGAILLLILNNL